MIRAAHGNTDDVCDVKIKHRNRCLKATVTEIFEHLPTIPDPRFRTNTFGYCPASLWAPHPRVGGISNFHIGWLGWSGPRYIWFRRGVENSLPGACGGRVICFLVCRGQYVHIFLKVSKLNF